MKAHLLKVKQEEGVEVYISKIRNTIAGCREKWRKMPKVRPFSNQESLQNGFFNFEKNAGDEGCIHKKGKGLN